MPILKDNLESRDLFYKNSLMKSLRFIILLAAVLAFQPNFGFGAENYKVGDKLYVAPTSGMNMRVSPSFTAPNRMQLSYNTVVTVIPDSLPPKPAQIAVSDFNSGELLLIGNWVKVSTGEITGYVFDGMLTRFPGLTLAKGHANTFFDSIFGTPKETIKEENIVMEGRKVDYKTKVKTYPKVLVIELTDLDGCYEEKYTFRTSFNEAYWLIQRIVFHADANKEIQINRLKHGAALVYYSGICF
jgi:hypothetical protein